MRWPFGRRGPRIAPDDVVDIVARNVALAESLDDEEHGLLVDRTMELIGTKRWEHVDDGPPSKGAALSTEMLVTVAANAAIPILRIDPWVYRHVHSVIVRPSTTVSRGVRAGPTRGTFSDHPTRIAGEALANAGPVALSWAAVIADSRTPNRGRNVVIHEFAHKIDMRDGVVDGNPNIRVRADAREFADVMDATLVRLREGSHTGPLRLYAATNRSELFAVASEAFFLAAGDLADSDDDLYSVLAAFYRQDPAAATPAVG